MDIPLDPTGLGITLQIVIIDLLLSADNALVIAIACRGLPLRDRGRAMVLGTGAAILLRILAAVFMVVALELPLLKLAGGMVLAIIAVRLLADEDEPAARPDGDAADDAAPPDDGTGDALRILRAVGAIIMADAVMSLDNIVAVAAVARGSLGFLALGLGLSIPLLIGGSALVLKVLDRTPVLVTLSGLYLGWIAGEIAVSDPAIASWVAADAPGLTVIVPVVGAVFVLWESRVLVHERRKRAGTDAAASAHRAGEE